MKRILVIISLLVLIVALPILMRRETATVSPDRADDRLVILSPHNETIRQEFGNAFAAWWKQRTGRTIYVDWRTPGGTSEISMVLDAGFKAAAETGRTGMGVDVFFGGGQPDFSKQAKDGRLVPLEVFTDHPDWFGEKGLVPSTFSGESYYPPDHVWVGCCLSQFGVCYDRDVLARLGVPAPQRWDDLGDPRLGGAVALADPTKSGSVARAFELLVQDQMQRSMRSGETASVGWNHGLQLILRMSANARYFTDSASKIPRDVGQGDAAAGMCIDFYGRTYHDELMKPDGTSRVDWRAPEGGATYSADPVAVLKGAPHPAIAQAFATFCLSPEGQRLWFGKPGTPGGPRQRALNRSPIRRDVYTPSDLANATVTINPYTDPATFTYNRDLTGKAFNTLRQFVRIACIDSHDELSGAWRALGDAGFPDEAMRVFSDVSAFSYEAYGHGDPILDGADPLKSAQRSSELGAIFRADFRKAELMARQSKAQTRTVGVMK